MKYCVWFCLEYLWIFSISNAMGQQKVLEPEYLVFQHGIMVAPDTSYFYSKYIDKTGRFLFQPGHTDLSTLDSEAVVSLPFKKDSVKNLRIEFIQNTDTLFCPFSFCINYSEPELISVYKKREERVYPVDYLLGDIFNSYILKALHPNLIEKEAVILISKSDEANKIIYRLVKVWDQGDKIKVFVSYGISKNLAGLGKTKTLEFDLAPVASKKSRRLLTNALSGDPKQVNCLASDFSMEWTLFNHEKRYFISPRCLTDIDRGSVKSILKYIQFINFQIIKYERANDF